jgi:hypothetical protein
MLHKLATILFLLLFFGGIAVNTAHLSAGWSGLGSEIDEPGSKALLATLPPIEPELRQSNRSLSSSRMSMLLGIGLVGLITLSRRKSSIASPKKRDKTVPLVSRVHHADTDR